MNEVNAQCGKVFVIGDNREKYSYDKKIKSYQNVFRRSWYKKTRTKC